jgi:hypothetical protein
MSAEIGWLGWTLVAIGALAIYIIVQIIISLGDD